MLTRFAVTVALGAAFFTALRASEAQETYVPLDEGVADVDPLAESLRLMEIDLREATAFDRVYLVPGREDLLMRVQGGTFAVFPRSRYTSTRFGLTPIVPNDTVYYIGTPSLAVLAIGGTSPFAPAEGTVAGAGPIRPRLTAPLDPRARKPREGRARDQESSGRVDEEIASRRARLLARRSGPLDAEAPAHRTILTDRGYRSNRVRDLMRRAAQAARGPSSSSSK